jgi:hypothetical protein
MSERQREGDQYLESDEETQDRGDEIREAFLQETKLGILQAADELVEWTNIFNRYINYLLLIQHPHEQQVINTSTIIGNARQQIASTTLPLIASIERTPGGRRIPLAEIPLTSVEAQLDLFIAGLAEQAALPPTWIPP